MGKMRPHRRGSRKSGAPWEPSPEQLQIYADCLRGNQTQKAVGAGVGLNQSQMSKLVARIDRWMIPRIMDNIRAMRVNHYGRVMDIYREAMDEAIRLKAEKKTGVAPLLGVALKALFDARQMFGANEAEKLAAESLERIAGVPRPDAIKMRIRELEVSFNDARTMIVEAQADTAAGGAIDPEDVFEFEEDDPEILDQE